MIWTLVIRNTSHPIYSTSQCMFIRVDYKMKNHMIIDFFFENDREKINFSFWETTMYQNFVILLWIVLNFDSVSFMLHRWKWSLAAAWTDLGQIWPNLKPYNKFLAKNGKWEYGNFDYIKFSNSKCHIFSNLQPIII